LFQLIDGNEQINPFAEVIKPYDIGENKTPTTMMMMGISAKRIMYTIQLMQPNERWTVDQAEQTVCTDRKRYSRRDRIG
jgi:hypothetical protein